MLTDLPYFATAEKYFDIGVIDMIARLVAATVIGMLIGLNRDVNGKPSGCCGSGRRAFSGSD